jgi:glycosyltransferase involved in cell wall biosynthesis
MNEVILIAYAISPTEGSESGAGWALLRAHIYLEHKMTLVTTRSELKKLREDKEFSSLKIKVVEIPEFKFLAKYSDIIPFSIQLRHLVWNLQIFHPVRRLTRTDPNLIVHYGTYAGDWNINILHLLNSRVYKLWGPVGGAQRIPLKFLFSLGPRGMLEDISKRLVGSTFRIVIKKRLSNSKSVILCANSATYQTYSKSTRVLLAQNIVLENLYPGLTERKSNMVFGCGRLIPWKNWRLAILAMKYVDDKHLIIAGEGPDLHRLEKIIDKHKLRSKVSLIGRIERETVLQYIRECDAFVFPSLRDSASWALAEGVLLKCKVVALDLPGSAAVTGKSGVVLIDAGQRNLEKSFGNAIASNPAVRNQGVDFDLSRLAEVIEESMKELLRI